MNSSIRGQNVHKRVDYLITFSKPPYLDDTLLLIRYNNFTTFISSLEIFKIYQVSCNLKLIR